MSNKAAECVNKRELTTDSKLTGSFTHEGFCFVNKEQ